ncbi:MAG: ZIP family metal transporter [Candidatus Omnitrophota bacterium]|nr:ZIP family metal transporter [Candidatus Omnitrophota bacterium]MDZ4243372.1 ZIP family metal transporter [Candidatus Omnitrophota bacterium]
MIDQSSLIFWTLTSGIISALATGLGAIPVHFMPNNSKMVRAFSSAFAAGMMISASVFSLVQQAISLQTRFPSSPYVVIVGLLAGALFFWITERVVSQYDLQDQSIGRGFTKKSLLIFVAMFIHSIPEGIAIGVGFATGNFEFGMIMAIAISVHNIPEGIAVSLPLKAEGNSTFKCAVISILTSIPQPVMAVPAAYFTWLFEPLLPLGLGFAGGAMIYLVFSELIPDALQEGGHTLTAWGVMTGLCAMLLLNNLLHLLPL